MPPLLSHYIGVSNEREVLTPQLPLIPSVAAVQTAMQFPSLNVSLAVQYGMVPGLIYTAKLDHDAQVYEGYLPRGTYRRAIYKLGKDCFVSDETIARLLSTFITGRP